MKLSPIMKNRKGKKNGYLKKTKCVIIIFNFVRIVSAATFACLPPQPDVVCEQS